MSPGSCPNCGKGILLRQGKRKKKCSKCGYIRYKSPHGHQRGTIIFPEKEKKKEKEIPSITTKEGEKELRRSLPKGEGYHTELYQNRKFMQDENIRFRNKAESIQRILKKLRRNKYNPIKEVEIAGELWDVESGKLVREKGRPKKKKEEELTPDRIIEEMVEEGS